MLSTIGCVGRIYVGVDMLSYEDNCTKIGNSFSIRVWYFFLIVISVVKTINTTINRLFRNVQSW